MKTNRRLAWKYYSKIRDNVKPDMGLYFKPAAERSFWDAFLKDEILNVPGEYLIRMAEELLKEEYPVILSSDYREFSKNGNREHFEEKYFKRRRMLGSLVLAECIEHKGRFTDKLIDGLYLILEETSWCLPAHNSYIRDTKQLPLPDKERPVIDLFAAETAELLGITEYLLREELSEVSSLINAYVEGELGKRIFTPYLTEHFWWMGNGEEPLLNWTPWITQNVLLSFFTRREGLLSTEELKRALEQAVLSIDDFMADYGDDGCCNEGAQYYSHAGLCLFGCIDVLDRITGNGFSGLYKEPLIGNIAAYIMRMYAGNGYYINFADCSPFPGRRSVRDYLFGLRVGNGAYASFARADFQSLDTEGRVMSGEQNLYYRLLSLEHYGELFAPSPLKEAEPWETEDFFFESTGLMIARDHTFTLAAKAGDNADSHNHNDVGSITLYKNKLPYLIDLGVETYTAKTFSPERYEIWTMQSQYHNTVSFVEGAGAYDENGLKCTELLGQRDGKEFAASEVYAELSDKEASLSMELSGAYGDERIRRIERIVTLLKGSACGNSGDAHENNGDVPENNDRCGYENSDRTPERGGSRQDGYAEEARSCKKKGPSVIIRDRIDSDLQAVFVLMTCEKPELTEPVREGRGRLSVGELGEISFEGMGSVVIETCPIKDKRLGKAWKDECYRILLAAEREDTVIEVY